MKDKRVVFMGTPLYSVPVLKMLIEAADIESEEGENSFE